MRICVAAVAMVLLTVPAYSQMSKGGGGRASKAPDEKSDSQKKVDEKAYKSALDRIPAPDKKYDPWRNAR
jgi:hypothetical protein